MIVVGWVFCYCKVYMSKRWGFSYVEGGFCWVFRCRWGYWFVFVVVLYEVSWVWGLGFSLLRGIIFFRDFFEIINEDLWFSVLF